MIAREGKRYVYRCELCGVKVSAPDLMNITEQRRLHALGNVTHLANTMGVVMQPFVDAYSRLAKSLVESVKPAMEMLEAATAQPNRPHDPALLRDKRKWGGR